MFNNIVIITTPNDVYHKVMKYNFKKGGDYAIQIRRR